MRLSSIGDSEMNYERKIELAKKEGFTYMYSWINSDESWTFLAQSYDEAYKKSIELYMEQKNEKDMKIAEDYYFEYIDIIELI